MKNKRTVSAPYLSIVIPCFDEVDSVRELYTEIVRAAAKLQKSFEIIFIDDGSTDGTFEVLRELNLSDGRVRCIQFRRNFGKSDALMAGFAAARGLIVVTMDADLQDDPNEIPRLIDELKNGYDVVSGWKYPRQDPVTKTVPSKVINWITAVLTGIKIHDMNCGFKAYRKDVVDGLRIYGEQHRFIPAIVGDRGFRVGEVKVRHRARKFGKTKYGVRRFFTGFLDLLAVLFLSRFVSKPLHIFGLIGAVPFLAGFAIVGYVLYLRLQFGSILNRHPLLIGGVMLVLMGMQFISTGLIAEMITMRAANDRDSSYAVKNKL